MSRDPDNLTPPPDPLAAALAKLEPAPPRLDRDRLMFQAGAESRRWVIRLWQFTAGILAAVGFAAGARMYFRPPVVVERVVYLDREPESQMPTPAAPAATGPLPSTAPPESPTEDATPERTVILTPAAPGDMAAWLELRNNVLTGGLGLLPDPGHRSSPTRIDTDQPGELPPGFYFAPW